ncbi:unnamed protein product, partial [Symbiodinium sp. CCMP2592]
MGANVEIITGAPARPAPPVCLVHGAVYHHSYCLQAEQPHEAKYAQLYLFDAEEAHRLRASRNYTLDAQLLRDLAAMLEEEANPYIAAYRRINEEPGLRLGFATATDADLRRYNHPQASEIAVAFRSEDGALTDPRTPGWHDHLQHVVEHRTPKYTRLTPAQFYSHRLMVRDLNCALPHGGSLLFQQYVVDTFCRMEGHRMSWLRMNQAKLRAESRSGIADYLAQDDDGIDRCGRPIILPASHAGSPRNMFQLYPDALAVVRRCDFVVGNAAAPSDEITCHIDARYVSAAEAAWRIFEFPLSGSTHTVVRRSVHLPNENMVTFAEGQEEAALQAPAGSKTTLTAWFDLNTQIRHENPQSEILAQTYIDIPRYCTWNNAARYWKLCKATAAPAQRVVGRLAQVSPTEGDRFFLYLLLLKTPGAQSFEDLRFAEGQQFFTFQAAATARGLCDSDSHYLQALDEVLATSPAARARKFLVAVLTCCDIGDPRALWTAFEDRFCEDFLHRLPKALALDATLQHVQSLLQTCGKTTSDFGLPLPAGFDAEAFRLCELREELSYDAAFEHAEACRLISSLNADQRRIFDEVVARLQWRAHGPASLPLCFLEDAHAMLVLVSRCTVLLWDEVGTAAANAVDAADACLQDLCDNSAPFAGKVVLLGGDLHQIIPRAEFADRAEVVGTAVTRSKVWSYPHMQRFSLTTNMRAAEDTAYKDFLLRVGSGTEPFDLDCGINAICLPPKLI